MGLRCAAHPRVHPGLHRCRTPAHRGAPVGVECPEDGTHRGPGAAPPPPQRHSTLPSRTGDPDDPRPPPALVAALTLVLSFGSSVAFARSGAQVSLSTAQISAAPDLGGEEEEDPMAEVATCLDSDTLGECVNCCLDAFVDDPSMFYVCVEECSDACEDEDGPRAARTSATSPRTTPRQDERRHRHGRVRHPHPLHDRPSRGRVGRADRRPRRLPGQRHPGRVRELLPGQLRGRAGRLPGLRGRVRQPVRRRRPLRPQSCLSPAGRLRAPAAGVGGVASPPPWVGAEEVAAGRGATLNTGTPDGEAPSAPERTTSTPDNGFLERRCGRSYGRNLLLIC